MIVLCEMKTNIFLRFSSWELFKVKLILTLAVDNISISFENKNGKKKLSNYQNKIDPRHLINVSIFH